MTASPDMIARRMDQMYESDKNSAIRRSHENKEVQKLYEEYLKEPCGHISHHLLHTAYMDRSGEVR